MKAGSTNAPAHHNNNISFLLNPTNSLSAVIDPNLESSVQPNEGQPPAAGMSESTQAGRTDSKDDPAEADHRVAYLLRNFSDAPGQ